MGQRFFYPEFTPPARSRFTHARHKLPIYPALRLDYSLLASHTMLCFLSIGS